MTKEDLWNLFKQTGNITYYLKYKEAIKKGK
ncbi:MAG: YqzL family protein [Tenericutes bacterium]|nr:YqzL family protein [Mycoplasmatota bacterium]MDD7629437.1 YqzL family protein [bacterium]MDO4377102.1 YqzL family protein [bacterium]MDY4108429.1 YqzL family protein [Bacilli bacterium]